MNVYKQLGYVYANAMTQKSTSYTIIALKGWKVILNSKLNEHVHLAYLSVFGINV